MGLRSGLACHSLASLLAMMWLVMALPAKLLAAESAEQGLAQQPHAPGIDLPAGLGRSLLLAACTRCHDLRGLPAYKGYWNVQRWRDMIGTMVKNGAPLDGQQADELALYLAEHFGVSPAP